MQTHILPEIKFFVIGFNDFDAVVLKFPGQARLVHFISSVFISVPCSRTIRYIV